MSVAHRFNKSAGIPDTAKPPRGKKKRLAPFSIRLTEAERARLAMEAAGAPLGAYIKAKALGDPQLRTRRTGIAVADRQALAQVLARLGGSHLALSLSRIADAVDIGALPMTPETEAELHGALRDVRAIRGLLLTALGMKGGGCP